MPFTSDPTDESQSQDHGFVRTFDPASEPASEAVVTAVAAVSGSTPVDLPPLHEVVDPDALDSLIDHADRVGTTGSHQVWFTYDGFDIGVRTDGEIRVRDATGTAN